MQVYAPQSALHTPAPGSFPPKTLSADAPPPGKLNQIASQGVSTFRFNISGAPKPGIESESSSAIPPANRVWFSAAGKLDKVAQAAALDVIRKGKDIDTIATILSNAYHHNYQKKLFSQDMCKTFLVGSQVENLKNALAKQGVTLTVTYQSKDGQHMCTDFVMTDRRLFLNRASSQQISGVFSEISPSLPGAVRDNVIGQYVASEPVDFTEENSEQFLEIFLSPQNPQRKREIIEQALEKNMGNYLARILTDRLFSYHRTQRIAAMLVRVDLTRLLRLRDFSIRSWNDELASAITEVIFSTPGRETCKRVILEQIVKTPDCWKLGTVFKLIRASSCDIRLSGVNVAGVPYDFRVMDRYVFAVIFGPMFTNPGNDAYKKQIVEDAIQTENGRICLNCLLRHARHHLNLPVVDLGILSAILKRTSSPS